MYSTRTYKLKKKNQNPLTRTRDGDFEEWYSFPFLRNFCEMPFTKIFTLKVNYLKF